MTTEMTRRALLTSATLGLAGVATAQDATTESQDSVLVLGVSCSPRKGKTTATSIAAALESAGKVNPRITTNLIDLGGMTITGSDGASSPGGAAGVEDDFNKLLPLLQSPNLGGMIIGSPCYFRSMSSLCKAFLERLAILRKPELLLADLPVGALSVGAYRNGGQELVIEQILTVMLCHECMLVGGKPRAHQGATLWNAYKDDITQDEFGMESAHNLGIRVAEAALKLKDLK